MISFVVQNFTSPPFLVKTQRYSKLVLMQNTLLLYLFIQNTLLNNSMLQLGLNNASPYVTLNTIIFRRTFWAFFRKILTSDFGILTTNLVKSAQHHTFAKLDTYFAQQAPQSTPHRLTTLSVQYVQPVVTLSFAFHKTYYNTFAFYLLFILPRCYNAPRNHFHLQYSFVLYPSSFALYPFTNYFYFKLRHY